MGTSIGKTQVLGDILSMGVTSISVIVRRREVAATLPPRSFMGALVRAPALAFPDGGGSGNRAYGGLCTALKAKLVQSGLMGFKDAKHGLKFMKCLVQVLYGLSGTGRIFPSAAVRWTHTSISHLAITPG